MRTWQENKVAIHELWPQHEFTNEEAKLWREDLGSLDQDRLYDAIRNAKRNRDTAWVHLRWIVEEYRALLAAERRVKGPAAREPKLNLQIDADTDRRLCDQFIALIKVSEPAAYADIEKRVLDKLDNMAAASAIRVLGFARQRLLGKEQTFGRVTRAGNIEPISVGPAR